MRRRVAALVLLLLLLPLAGCSVAAPANGGSGTDTAVTKYKDGPTSPSNVVEVQRLQGLLNQLPTAEKATVNYSLEGADAKWVLVNVRLKPTVADAEKVGIADYAEQLVWQSYLSPLQGAHVTIEGPQTGWRETVDFTQRSVVDEMVSRWGERHGF